jgi:protein TonB
MLGFAALILASAAATAHDGRPIAIVRDEAGTAGFDISVGKNGRARNCRIVRSSGDAALDAAACRLLRARGAWAVRRNDRGEPIDYHLPISLAPSALRQIPR